MRDARDEAGFTLIEVMLALGVFFIGFLGLISLQMVGIDGAKRARDVALGTNLGTSVLEQLHVVDPTTVADQELAFDPFGVLQDNSDPYFTNPYFLVEVNILQVPTTADAILEAEVTTSWKRSDNDPRHLRDIPSNQRSEVQFKTQVFAPPDS